MGNGMKEESKNGDRRKLVCRPLYKGVELTVKRCF